ncbi:MAG: PEGA domain-containing protein, partial [Polyangiaceae bacterium]
MLSIDTAAQAKDPAAAARDLARAGWDALDKQDYKDALDKVTEAEGLYHAPTHLLLMGNAQAGLGKLVDALATFEKLAAEPLTAAAPNAFKEAQETGRKRMKELLARVPSLLVVVTSAEAAGPTVTLDGQKVTFAGGVAVRCDPGEHTIVVEAEGFPTVTQKVTLPEKGGVVRVPITLEKPGAPASTSSASASASVAPSGTATVAPAPGPQIKPLTFITLGVAGAGLVVGAITGGITLGAAGDLKKRCPDNHCPNDEQGAFDSANALAT